MASNSSVEEWVDECARLCRPDTVHWCDGSEEEKERLIGRALACGELIELNRKRLPDCYLHRSAENDVARMENLTFICCPDKEDAGPTNNWMDPADAYARLGKIFERSMSGRTMYVVPFLMGPEGSPFTRVGVGSVAPTVPLPSWP